MILLQNLQLLLNGNKLILFFPIIFFSHLLAQQSDFDVGIRKFNEGNYSEAIQLLEKYTLKETDLTEKANLILTLSYFKLNNFERCKFYIQRFEEHYPNSKSLSIILETKLAIGILEKNLNDIHTTLYKFNRVNLNRDKIEGLTGAFRKVIDLFDTNQLTMFESSILNPILKFSFYKAKFDNAILKRDPSAIKKYYNLLIQTGAEDNLLKIRKIGVLLPTDVELSSAEKSILEGLKLAVHNYNDHTDSELELKIFKGNEKFLENALNELAKDPEVLCVIGPLYSNQFKRLAILADRLSIPMISPTATAADISLNSKYIFQFNPTLDVRGSVMAKYALEKMKINRAVILSTENRVYKPIVNELKRKIKASKCEILADLEWKENKRTLGGKIKEIRKAAVNRDFVLRFNSMMDFETEQKLISLGIDQFKIDSLKDLETEVSIYELFGSNAEKICQVNRIPFFKRSQSIVNDLSIPVYSIDVIFITISNPELIAEITNELEKHNIITQIIGNDIWNSLENLNKGYPATNGVIFTSDFYFDSDSKLLKDFSSEVQNLTGGTINRHFFYGYETINKIFENWNNKINRENFYDFLLKDRDYKGLSSDIILNENGVNSSVYILEYRNRKIKKIDRIISE